MKIIGIGNALVDALTVLEDDSLLQELNLARGGMSLIDAEKHHRIQGLYEKLHTSRSTGGSAGNTMLALAKLGMHPGFVGCVGRDELGRFFRDNCRETGIEDRLMERDAPTGVANTFISADAERTFGTFLGASGSFCAEDVSAQWFRGYGLLHIEGYLVQNHDLILRVAQVAKEAGLMLSLDLASYTVVEADRDFMRHLVREYIDIVFANEEESVAFSGGKTPREALQELSEMTQVAVVKLGSKGSMSLSHGTFCRVDACRVNVVDATAAGDFFAGGFLYAYAQGAPMQVCLECGALLAGQVIQVIGTRLPEDTWTETRARVTELLGR